MRLLGLKPLCLTSLIKNRCLMSAEVEHTCNPSNWRLVQEDFKSEVCLGYTVLWENCSQCHSAVPIKFVLN